MQVLGFHHTGRTVADMERALRFYRDLLGMQVVDDAEISGPELSQTLGIDGAEVRAVMLSADGGPPFMELFEYRSPASVARAANAQPSDVGDSHPCLLVDDIHAAYERLSGAGVALTCPPQEIHDGPQKGEWVLFGDDPDGAAFELWSIPPKS